MPKVSKQDLLRKIDEILADYDRYKATQGLWNKASSGFMGALRTWRGAFQVNALNDEKTQALLSLLIRQVLLRRLTVSDLIAYSLLTSLFFRQEIRVAAASPALQLNPDQQQSLENMLPIIDKRDYMLNAIDNSMVLQPYQKMAIHTLMLEKREEKPVVTQEEVMVKVRQAFPIVADVQKREIENIFPTQKALEEQVAEDKEDEGKFKKENVVWNILLEKNLHTLPLKTLLVLRRVDALTNKLVLREIFRRNTHDAIACQLQLVTCWISTGVKQSVDLSKSLDFWDFSAITDNVLSDLKRPMELKVRLLKVMSIYYNAEKKMQTIFKQNNPRTSELCDRYSDTVRWFIGRLIGMHKDYNVSINAHPRLWFYLFLEEVTQNAITSRIASLGIYDRHLWHPAAEKAVDDFLRIFLPGHQRGALKDTLLERIQQADSAFEQSRYYAFMARQQGAFGLEASILIDTILSKNKDDYAYTLCRLMQQVPTGTAYDQEKVWSRISTYYFEKEDVIKEEAKTALYTIASPHGYSHFIARLLQDSHKDNAHYQRNSVVLVRLFPRFSVVEKLYVMTQVAQRYLSAKQPTLRETGCRVLDEMACCLVIIPPALINTLLSALYDGDITVCRTAAHVLIGWSDRQPGYSEAYVKAIAFLSRHGDVQRRLLAYDILRALLPLMPKLLPKPAVFVESGFQDKEASVRSAACQLLGVLLSLTQDEKCREPYKVLLQSRLNESIEKDMNVRLVAAKELMRFEKIPVMKLYQYILASEVETQRTQLMNALSAYPIDQCVAVIEDLPLKLISDTASEAQKAREIWNALSAKLPTLSRKSQDTLLKSKNTRHMIEQLHMGSVLTLKVLFQQLLVLFEEEAIPDKHAAWLAYTALMRFEEERDNDNLTQFDSLIDRLLRAENVLVRKRACLLLGELIAKTSLPQKFYQKLLNYVKSNNASASDFYKQLLVVRKNPRFEGSADVRDTAKTVLLRSKSEYKELSRTDQELSVKNLYILIKQHENADKASMLMDFLVHLPMQHLVFFLDVLAYDASLKGSNTCCHHIQQTILNKLRDLSDDEYASIMLLYLNSKGKSVLPEYRLAKFFSIHTVIARKCLTHLELLKEKESVLYKVLMDNMKKKPREALVQQEEGLSNKLPEEENGYHDFLRKLLDASDDALMEHVINMENMEAIQSILRLILPTLNQSKAERLYLGLWRNWPRDNNLKHAIKIVNLILEIGDVEQAKRAFKAMSAIFLSENASQHLKTAAADCLVSALHNKLSSEPVPQWLYNYLKSGMKRTISRVDVINRRAHIDFSNNAKRLIGLLPRLHFAELNALYRKSCISTDESSQLLYAFERIQKIRKDLIVKRRICDMLEYVRKNIQSQSAIKDTGENNLILMHLINSLKKMSSLPRIEKKVLKAVLEQQTSASYVEFKDVFETFLYQESCAQSYPDFLNTTFDLNISEERHEFSALLWMISREAKLEESRGIAGRLWKFSDQKEWVADIKLETLYRIRSLSLEAYQECKAYFSPFLKKYAPTHSFISYIAHYFDLSLREEEKEIPLRIKITFLEGGEKETKEVKEIAQLFFDFFQRINRLRESEYQKLPEDLNALRENIIERIKVQSYQSYARFSEFFKTFYEIGDYKKFLHYDMRIPSDKIDKSLVIQGLLLVLERNAALGKVTIESQDLVKYWIIAFDALIVKGCLTEDLKKGIEEKIKHQTMSSYCEMTHYAKIYYKDCYLELVPKSYIECLSPLKLNISIERKESLLLLSALKNHTQEDTKRVAQLLWHHLAINQKPLAAEEKKTLEKKIMSLPINCYAHFTDLTDITLAFSESSASFDSSESFESFEPFGSSESVEVLGEPALSNASASSEHNTGLRRDILDVAIKLLSLNPSLSLFIKSRFAIHELMKQCDNFSLYKTGKNSKALLNILLTAFSQGTYIHPSVQGSLQKLVMHHIYETYIIYTRALKPIFYSAGLKGSIYASLNELFSIKIPEKRAQWLCILEEYKNKKIDNIFLKTELKQLKLLDCLISVFQKGSISDDIKDQLAQAINVMTPRTYQFCKKMFDDYANRCGLTTTTFMKYLHQHQLALNVKESDKEKALDARRKRCLFEYETIQQGVAFIKGKISEDMLSTEQLPVIQPCLDKPEEGNHMSESMIIIKNPEAALEALKRAADQRMVEIRYLSDESGIIDLSKCWPLLFTTHSASSQDPSQEPSSELGGSSAPSMLASSKPL